MRAALFASLILLLLSSASSYGDDMYRPLNIRPAIGALPPPVAQYQFIDLPFSIDLYKIETFAGTKYLAIKPRLQIVRIDTDGKKWIQVLFVSGAACTPTQMVTCAAEELYFVQYDTIINAPRNVQGTVIGVLAVPFKFHANDHSTTAGSTIGGYFGWEAYRSALDTSFSVIGAGGLALVPQKAATAPSTTGAKADTPPADGTTLTGLSLALGVIGKAKGNFQFGFLVGSDWVGKDKKYKYEGKPWFSIAFGYNFDTPTK